MNIFENVWFKNILASLVTILIAIIIYSLIKGVINKIFNIKVKGINSKKQKTLHTFFKNIAKWIIIIITLVVLLGIFGIDTGVIVTSLGAVTVVLGLAFQDILKDFIAGISMIFQNSYNVGDTITINGFKGEVIYMGMKVTKLKAAGGEVFIINNGAINEVINHTVSNALAAVTVGVAYESDIEKVEDVLNKLANKLSKKIPSLKNDIKVLGIEDLGDSAIVFKIVAEVEANTQFDVQRLLRKEIKLEFDKNNISIPYNQLVIHNE